MDYEEIDMVGRGTYGKVFRVRSYSDYQVYVMKKITMGPGSKSAVEASMKEAQVLSSLR